MRHFYPSSNDHAPSNSPGDPFGRALHGVARGGLCEIRAPGHVVEPNSLLYMYFFSKNLRLKKLNEITY